MTPARAAKVAHILGRRQSDVAVVLEEVHDPHNIAAILRSCDAFGVGAVHLLYPSGRSPKKRVMRSKAAASAAKWLNIQVWHDQEALLAQLKKEGKRVYGSVLQEGAVDPLDAPLADPVAIVVGNEHRGITPELAAHVDGFLRIPMMGFVESFNVSVATALLLYEVYRQREHAGRIPA